MIASLLVLALAQAPEAATSQLNHEPSAYLQSGVQLYLGPGRTTGGLGAGAGVRDVYRARWVGQLDASWLVYLGNAFSVRAGAGVQRDGVWSPMVLGTATLWLGSQVRVSSVNHPNLVSGPGTTLGVAASPLRFRAGGAEVSALELGVGLGSDWPGLAWAFQLQLLQVGLLF